MAANRRLPGTVIVTHGVTPAPGRRVHALRSCDLDLSDDDDWQVEWQGGDTDRRPALSSGIGPSEGEDQLGRGVDHRCGLAEARFGVDVTVHHEPSRYTVEIAERALRLESKARTARAG